MLLLGNSYKWQHNIWVTLSCISGVILFIMLSIWQITRGIDKSQELSIIDYQDKQPYLSLSDMQLVQQDAATSPTLFFHPVNIRGRFVDKTFLLDNSIYKDMLVTDKTAEIDNPYCYLLSTCGKKIGSSKVGYRIFGLFLPDDAAQLLLVERGWVDGSAGRAQIPIIEVLSATVSIQGIIMPNAGRRRVLLEDVLDVHAAQQLVQRVAADEYQEALGLDIYAHPIILVANSPGALTVFAPLANFSYLSAARHYGYAFQWLLMALALLTLYIIVSLKKQDNQ